MFAVYSSSQEGLDNTLTRPTSSVAGVAFLLLTVLLTAGVALRFERRKPEGGRLRFFPKTVLWAWERPEDLRSIKDGKAGVAFLARSLYLRGGDVLGEPRRQPLQAPEGAALMAVVRVDSDRAQPP